MKLHSLPKIAFLFSIQSVAVFASPFAQTNLVSNVPGLAANFDANLKNPWGISHSATSPFWISNQASNNSTLYSAVGAIPQALVVSVGPTAPPPTGPTGQVFAGIAGNFVENGAPANFIFATLAGSIDAWNGSNGTTAAVVASTPGAVYTGLALGNNGTANFLYAANFAGGRVDVFNSSFAPATLAGSFTDPNLPAGYVPYNIQNIGGKLYVEYAQVDPNTHEAAEGAGLGVVDVFDTSGNFLQRIHSGGQLNAPWGIAIAPNGFGEFGGDVLVGNFGDGTITPSTPSPAITWARSRMRLAIRSSMTASGHWISAPIRARLFITAGINDEADGLFARNPSGSGTGRHCSYRFGLSGSDGNRPAPQGHLAD